MYLDDEPSSYYEGRFEINNWKTGKNISQISLDYDLDPFALSMFSTLEPWLWDPFDFLNMDIPTVDDTNFKDLTVPAGETSATVCYLSDIVGSMPVIPTFYVSDSDENGISITVYNSYNAKWSRQITVHNNSESNGYTDPLITFSTPTPGSATWLFFSGAGKLSIDFRPGRL